MNGYALYRNAWRFEDAPHLETRLEPEEWKSLLKKGGLLVRNTYNFDCQDVTSFWYVIKDQYEGLEALPSRVRNKIRHAFNSFEYRLIPFDTIKEKGFQIIKETYDDYAIHDRKMNQEVFTKYLEQCHEKPFDYWGIFDKETQQMVGFCTVTLWDHCCEYGMTGILSKYKRNGSYPYYGLYHRLNEYYIDQQHFRYVSDSARTITEHSQIQDFLIQNYHFRKSYCQLAIHYRWWMKIIINMLYPFRKIIPLQRVKAILNMEAMQRGEK